MGKSTGPLFVILQCEAVTDTGAKCVDTGKGDLDFSESCIGALDANGDIFSVAGVSSGSETVTVFCNPYLDIGAIVDEGFISNSAAVKSAKTSRNTTATNSPSGSYGWYVDSAGLIRSFPPNTKGLYP